MAEIIERNGILYCVEGSYEWEYTVQPSKTLNQVKQDKVAELQSASDKATAAFQSSALGVTKTYLADEKSMTFLSGEYAFVHSPNYDATTYSMDWYTIEDNTFVPHTGAQIAQVFLDGRTWIKEQKTVKLKELLTQVASIAVSDTVTEQDAINQVQAIKW
jgi:hypothetical protein